MAYSVPDLPYDYNALEPHIDEATMRVHHDKHHQAYVDKANAALEGTEWDGKPVEEVLQNLSKLGDKVEKGRVPLIGRAKARMAKMNIWGRIVDRVLRRPLVSTLVAGGLLLALAAPAVGLKLAEACQRCAPFQLYSQSCER